MPRDMRVGGPLLRQVTSPAHGRAHITWSFALAPGTDILVIVSVAEETVQIQNKLGLHLRAATILVKTAGGFSSSITLTRGKESANARSVIGLMTLGAGVGTRLKVKAEGSDADDAVKAIKALFDDKFGEE